MTQVSSPVIGTVRFTTGNRTGVDAEICATTASIVATEAIVLRGGGRWAVSDRAESSGHGR